MSGVLRRCVSIITDITDNITNVYCSEYPQAPPPSRCKSASSLVNDDLLVHIKLKLVDQNCPQFVSKHNSVSILY